MICKKEIVKVSYNDLKNELIDKFKTNKGVELFTVPVVSSSQSLIKETKIFKTRATYIKVKTGDIVIFPGWVDHQSLPNKSDDERIIIGTNYFAMGQLGKHENKDYIEIG